MIGAAGKRGYTPVVVVKSAQAVEEQEDELPGPAKE
jgi:hypothetical protein